MVVLVGQAAGLIALILIAIVLRDPLPPAADLIAMAIAGTFGTLGVVRFYRELSRGRMGIVAPLTAVVEEIEAAGKVAKGWTVDLDDREAIGSAFAEIGTHYGGMDILVNNAGGPPPGRPLQTFPSGQSSSEPGSTQHRPQKGLCAGRRS